MAETDEGLLRANVKVVRTDLYYFVYLLSEKEDQLRRRSDIDAAFWLYANTNEGIATLTQEDLKCTMVRLRIYCEIAVRIASCRFGEITHHCALQNLLGVTCDDKTAEHVAELMGASQDGKVSHGAYWHGLAPLDSHQRASFDFPSEQTALSRRSSR